MEFVLTEKEKAFLEEIRQKFIWKNVAEGDTWYVLDEVIKAADEHTQHYKTDLLYEVARLAPLMQSEEPPQERPVAAIGIRTMGVDGIHFIHARLEAHDCHYNALFLLEEGADYCGRRMFKLWRMEREADE